VKRFTLAAMVLFVALISMTTYFVRVGIDLHRRGFTPVEIAIAIGATVALNVAICGTVLITIRGLHTAVSRRR
jgi:hypothetical protein